MSEYLRSGLSYGLVGAALGGMVGVASVLFSTLTSASTQQNSSTASSSASTPDLSRYTNLSLDSVLMEALQRFRTYETLIPREFVTVVDNLNKLVGIQVAINQGQIESYYPFRATTYVTNVQTALNAAQQRVRNVSVPHWESDTATLRQVADDYLYNITQDVNQHMLERRTQ